MSGRMTPPCPIPDLNSDDDRSDETIRPTGQASGTQPPPTPSPISRPTFEYVITPLSDESLPIMALALRSSEWYTSSGGQLEWGRVVEPGRWAVNKLILRIHEPSFGTDTEVRRLLSSMNLEAGSTLRIFSGGQTGILSEWKSRADLSLFLAEF